MSEQFPSTLPNKELAEEYFRVTSQVARQYTHARDFATYGMMKRLIEGACIDISVFYAEHGRSLDELKIRGIGEKVKHVLEVILDNGEEEAKIIIMGEKEEEIARKRIPGRYLPRSPVRQKKYDDFMRNRRD